LKDVVVYYFVFGFFWCYLAFSRVDLAFFAHDYLATRRGAGSSFAPLLYRIASVLLYRRVTQRYTNSVSVTKSS